MKRSALLQHLRTHGRILKREGGSHSLWANPANGAVEAVPRHTEIGNNLAQEDLPRESRRLSQDLKCVSRPRRKPV